MIIINDVIDIVNIVIMLIIIVFFIVYLLINIIIIVLIVIVVIVVNPKLNIARIHPIECNNITFTILQSQFLKLIQSLINKFKPYSIDHLYF